MSWQHSALLAVLVGLSTMAIPIGFDEAVWSTIGTEWFGGARLYVDVIDNKSPIVFGIAGLLDALPGPFPIARGVALAGLAMVLSWSAARVVSMASGSVDGSTAFAGTIAISAVLLSTGLLTIELVSVTLAVAAMAIGLDGRRPVLSALLVAVTPAIDPRMAVLLPGLTYWVASRATRPRLVWMTVTFAAVGGLAVVLVHPDLRFALVELNIRGSRVEAIDVASQLIAMLRAGAVFAGALFVIVRVRRPSGVALVLLVPAVVISWLSFRPFEHYWVLLVPGVVAWGSAGFVARERDRVFTALLFALAVLPMLAQTVVSHQLTARETESYRDLLPAVMAATSPDGAYIAFDNRPWLPYLYPEANAIRSPVLGYLATPSSRLEQGLDEVTSLLASGSVVAIIDDGGLSVPIDQMLDEALPMREVIDPFVTDYPCRLDGRDGLTLRVRTEICARLGPYAQAANPTSPSNTRSDTD